MNLVNNHNNPLKINYPPKKKDQLQKIQISNQIQDLNHSKKNNYKRLLILPTWIQKINLNPKR